MGNLIDLVVSQMFDCFFFLLFLSNENDIPSVSLRKIIILFYFISTSI